MRTIKIRFLIEQLIKAILFFCAFLSVIITLFIFFDLAIESLSFFKSVSFSKLFFDTTWSPLFENPHYGIIALFSGTLLTTFIAMSVALPLGLIISIYLSEFISLNARETLKPIIELLAAVPTVIYGYFALLIITPFLKLIFPHLESFNALSAGIAMGIMIIPYISSLAEDSMRAVPQYLREGSFALGASKLQTALKVILPASFSGLSTAFVLGFSRAIGETMIVAIAAGLEPKFSFNPLASTETITAYIVQVTQGDLPHGSIGYQTVYVCGLSLFVFTLLLNIVASYLRKRMVKRQ